MQQPDRHGSNQRRLLGWLREHRVTGGECGAHLAEKDREREVPRADADHRPERLRLATVSELAAYLLRIVAAEVDRLSYLGHRIRRRLSGLAHRQSDQCCAVGFERVGRALKQRRTKPRRHCLPAGCERLRSRECCLDVALARLDYSADAVGAVGRIEHRQPLAIGNVAAGEHRRSLPVETVQRGQFGGQHGERMLVAKIDAG